LRRGSGCCCGGIGGAPQVKTIYIITNLINGKQYIEQTSQPLKTRFD
jgi:hypothetical protein